ncbi:MAG: type II secretion system protein GspG [Luteolibacter sp.]|nr:type II secretion system protein GspG [Luteolibacter sp.]
MKFRIAALLLAIAAGCWLAWFPTRAPVVTSDGLNRITPPPGPTKETWSPGRAVSRTAGDTPPAAVVHPEGAAFGRAGVSPQREIEVLMNILEAYRREFGAFPAGEDNAQVLNALAGGNPQRIWFFPRPHPRLDAAGNLLDSWGNPYFFHMISRDHLEIRSRGADGELFTSDDPAHPPPRP